MSKQLNSAKVEYLLGCITAKVNTLSVDTASEIEKILQVIIDNLGEGDDVFSKILKELESLNEKSEEKCNNIYFQEVIDHETISYDLANANSLAFTVVEGTAEITIGEETVEYPLGEVIGATFEGLASGDEINEIDIDATEGKVLVTMVLCNYKEEAV